MRGSPDSTRLTLLDVKFATKPVHVGYSSLPVSDTAQVLLDGTFLTIGKERSVRTVTVGPAMGAARASLPRH